MSQPQVFYDDFDLGPHLSSSYMSGAFANILYGIARFSGARTLVEVGVWKGLTATLLAQAARFNGGHAWGVDVGEFETEARQRVERMGLSEHWTYLTCDSAQAGQHWEHGPINFLMIDAGHGYESVAADIQAWIPHVAPGAYIFFHDYNLTTGVWRAVNEFLEENGDEYTRSMKFCWEHGAMVVRRKAVGE